MENIYEVQFDEGIKYFCTHSSELALKISDVVIVKNDKVMDMGEIVEQKAIKKVANGANLQGMPIIVRHANLFDKGKAHENAVRSKSMHRTGMEKIKKHELPMKLISTHCTFDKSLVIFMFSADGRVDFRELVRDLSKSLNMRVELRQIGVRDETAILGGIGTCGRRLCCNSFLKSFESINVKIAKDQGLSLNPTNISGNCGRLKCCLKYEHDAYQFMGHGMPKPGMCCHTPEGKGSVIECNYLKRKVRVKLSNDTARYVEVDVENISFNKKNKC